MEGPGLAAAEVVERIAVEGAGAHDTVRGREREALHERADGGHLGVLHGDRGAESDAEHVVYARGPEHVHAEVGQPRRLPLHAVVVGLLQRMVALAAPRARVVIPVARQVHDDAVDASPHRPHESREVVLAPKSVVEKKQGGCSSATGAAVRGRG